MEVSELIALYNRAWSEPDYALRQKLLEQIWAEDGTYTDPTAHVAGRKALVDHIGAFFEQFPGAYFVVTSGIDSHHGKFRFTWRMVLADGKVFLEGIDFGELNSDGKLHRIVGFFGPLAQAIRLKLNPSHGRRRNAPARGGRRGRGDERLRQIAKAGATVLLAN